MHNTAEQEQLVVYIMFFLLIFQLNPGVSAFQRHFVKEVKKCEEMERILSKNVYFIITSWFTVFIDILNTYDIF